jgi:predicted enzyme related to lactoylglutathione lyase
MNTQNPGAIGWVDLTVPDATAIRDFYAEVTGWKPSAIDMGGYQDYCMHDEDGETVSGICHKRGENADLPAVWLVYFLVRNLEESLEVCISKGGKQRSPIRSAGSQGRYCIIEDPAGAVAGLYEPLLRAA